jgi:hypothetical protein
VAVPEALETLPRRIQSVVVVFEVSPNYILPRIPSSPTFYILLVSFLLSGSSRKTSLYFP